MGECVFYWYVAPDGLFRFGFKEYPHHHLNYLDAHLYGPEERGGD